MKTKCPKCGSSIGIHYAQFPVHICSEAHGVRCFICGYWEHLQPLPHIFERIDVGTMSSSAKV